MDLSEFLLARIAEDEAAARDVIEASPWPNLHLGDNALAPEWPFAKRFDPARILAECEAKRELLALADPYDFADDGGTGMSVHADMIRKLLAMPYADHPDWREEWRA